VATPQLAGIHDSLALSASAHFDRLEAAQELSERLQARLRAVTESSNGGFFDGMP
jgi:hypothetical protein